MIGTNSPDSMRAGVIGGIACMIDGMIERYEEELGEKAAIVATGGYASLIAPLCRRELIVDPDLVLEGLHIIYKKIRRSKRHCGRNRQMLFLRLPAVNIF